MNYLQLTQTLHQLLRADNNKLGAAPTSVAAQDGLLGELVFFIDRAWQDIQNMPTRWRFMRSEGRLILPAGLDTISPSAIPDFDSYLLAEYSGRGRFLTMFRETVADETTIRYVPYPEWQQSYLDRGDRGIGQPGSFTILPNSSLKFDLKADVPYTILLKYRRSTQPLVDNADVPIMPARHHMAIVWFAIANYYCTTRDGAEGLRQRSLLQLNREMRSLHNEQGDDVLVPEGCL